MSKYTINFKIDGLIDIEAKTEDEAFKKYSDLTWNEVIENGYDMLEETEIMYIIESTNKTLD